MGVSMVANMIASTTHKSFSKLANAANGRSQIMYCGLSTWLNATKASSGSSRIRASSTADGFSHRMAARVASAVDSDDRSCKYQTRPGQNRCGRRPMHFRVALGPCPFGCCKPQQFRQPYPRRINWLHLQTPSCMELGKSPPRQVKTQQNHGKQPGNQPEGKSLPFVLPKRQDKQRRHK